MHISTTWDGEEKKGRRGRRKERKYFGEGRREILRSRHQHDTQRTWNAPPLNSVAVSAHAVSSSMVTAGSVGAFIRIAHEEAWIRISAREYFVILCKATEEKRYRENERVTAECEAAIQGHQTVQREDGSGWKWKGKKKKKKKKKIYLHTLLHRRR